MSVLLVNICKEKLHYFEFVKPIEDILKKASVNYFTRGYLEIRKDILKKADKVIICGTSLKDFDYLESLDKFDWLKDFNGTVLGICGGMQVIGRVFGGGEKKKLEIGYFKEKLEKEFLGLKGEVEVYHLHQNYIDFSSINDFEVYCSNEGVSQATKHKEKEIYGVLFHPEVRNKEVILNFVRLRNG